MNRLLYTLAAAALAVSWGAVRAGVVGSVHDLTTATGTTTFTTTGDTAEVCVFCHTPHGGDATAGPLWNRDLATGPYQMYSSSTLDMTIAGSPQGVSAACLSCHDGAVAFDVLINAPTSASGTYGYTAGGAKQNYTFTAGDSMAGQGAPTEFGTNLTNQHPISITYDTGQDADFNAASGGAVGSLPLYGTSSDQVECGTCHDPHETGTAPFLRISNAASALCTTCHIK